LTTAPAAAAAAATAADRKRRHRRRDDDAMETDVRARGGSQARWKGDGEKTHVGPLLPRTRPPLVFSLIFCSVWVLGGAESCPPKVAAKRQGGSYTLSSSGNSPARLLLGDPILPQPQAFACTRG
jgi:hypothetical protein